MDEKKSFFKLNGIGDPKWLILTVTVPQIILFFIFLDIFLILKNQFNLLQKNCWIIFGLILIGLSTGYLVYAIIRIIQKKEIHTIVSLIIITTYTAYIYTMAFYLNKMILNIPTWIFDIIQNFKYFASFLLPAYFYALLIGQKFLKNAFKEKKIWVNFIIVMTIPLFWYVFYSFILKPIERVLWDYKIYQTTLYRICIHSLTIFIIILILSFFFFLIRGLTSLLTNRINIIRKLKILWIALFCLVFPLLGLLLNECYFPFSFLKHKLFFDNFHIIFGNFSNPLFFVLTIINGLLLIVPNLKNKIFRMILLILRCIMFIYTLYFFVSFLPFYPFFIFALIIFGAGFLLVSPLLILIIHANIIKEDFNYLKNFFSTKFLFIIIAVSLTVMPCLFFFNLILIKLNLYKALSFTYYPDFANDKKTNINIKSLNNTLKIIEATKQRPVFFNNTSIPYITSLYNKIVLNNLTLSEQKINDLRCLFNNEENINYSKNSKTGSSASEIEITNLNYKTEYDKNTMLYSTWIDLDLKSHGPQEFKTYINLPEGAWINDYYLYINDKKKTGLLREKKSALWIYEQIKNTSRDPGIMYYINKKTIAMRVFPFTISETRKTGFKIIHIEPLKIIKVNNSINISTIDRLEDPIVSKDKNIIYVPARFKNKIKKTTRNPYYHFIIDCSARSSLSKYNYIETINKFLDKNYLTNENAMITLADYNISTFKLDKDFDKKLLSHKNSGGFNLDRALKSIIYDNINNNDNNCPVIIVVSNDLNYALLNDDISDFASFTPDIDSFYKLDVNGYLFKYDLNNLSNIEFFKSNKLETKQVLKWQNKDTVLYMENTNNPSLLFLYDDKINPINNKKDKNKDMLNNLLSLHALYDYKILHPEKTNTLSRKIFIDAVELNILNPLTSFVVLEDDTQEKMLLKKQKEVLNSENFLDASDDPKEMPEPSLILLIIILIILLTVFKLTKKT